MPVMPKKEKKPAFVRRYQVASILFVALLFIGWAVYTAQTAAGPADDARGWAWNAYELEGGGGVIGTGWTSLSCLNDFDNDGLLENQCPTGAGARQYSLEIDTGADGILNGAADDYVKGCAWSSAYGWICFNGGTGSSYQCDESQLANPDACADLSTTGVKIQPAATKHCSITYLTCNVNGDCPAQSGQAQTCNADYYYLDSTYSGGIFSAPAAIQRATILSLWSSADKDKSYVSFPFTTAVPATPPDTLYGCTQCDPVTGKCGACLNVSTEPSDPTSNPSPNILCWACGGNGTPCTVNENGGSCINNRDKNQCDPSSCAGCAAFTGVLVNQTRQADFEMCGWGYNGYTDSIAVTINPEVVDDATGSTDIGQQASMVMPTDYLPAIAYAAQDPAAGSVWKTKFAKCVDPLCQMKRTIFIDTLGSASTVAIEVGNSDNNPVVAYVDTNGTDKLKVAKCSSVDCSGTVTITTLVTLEGLNEVAIKNGSDGYPAISYYNGLANGGDLMFIHCKDTGCGNGTTPNIDGPTPLDTTGDTGRYSSITKNTYPVISYIDNTNKYLKVFTCTNPTCSGASQTVDSTATGAVQYTSISLLTGGIPVISYTANSGTDRLKVAKCSTTNCSGAATINTIALSSTIGRSSLAIDADGFPIVSFYKTTGGLFVTKCYDTACTSGPATMTIHSGSVGQYSTLRLGADEYPLIAYYDTTNKSLRAAYCPTRSCSPTTQRGLGWFAFNPQYSSGLTYVEGQGNIFSGANIYSPVGPPITKYNAAYILEATGSIKNWFSQSQYNYQNVGSAPTYLTPGASSGQPKVYGNALATIDYQGIVTSVTTGQEVSQTSQTGTNKYGGQLVYRAPSDHGPADSNALDNRVFFWSSPNVTMNAFTVNCQSAKSGAGIFVVDGDLTITGDITYGASCNSGLTKIKEIASPVWIVRGDLTIDPAVTQIVGTFIILGDGNPAKCPALTSSSSNGCGRFSSGTAVTQLVSQGPVFARQFNLQRSFSGSLGPEPAELFMTDGRFQSNPPAGMTDFSRSVPRFTIGF